MHARDHLNERDAEARKEDAKLLEYATFLKNRFRDTESQISNLEIIRDRFYDENSKKRAELTKLGKEAFIKHQKKKDKLTDAE